MLFNEHKFKHFKFSYESSNFWEGMGMGESNAVLNINLEK